MSPFIKIDMVSAYMLRYTAGLSLNDIGLSYNVEE